MNGKKRILQFFTILVIILSVMFTLYSPIPGLTEFLMRTGLILGFFFLWRYFAGGGLTEYRDLSFALLTLNIAFLAAMPFTSSFWRLDTGTPSGLAISKLSDAVITGVIIIVLFILAGYHRHTIYLRAGRLTAGITTGTVFFLLFGYLALNNPAQKPEPGFISENYIWILLFVFSNAFMEELVFRGILLEKLNRLFRPAWSVFLTSVCFAMPHIIVNYQADALLFTGIVFALGLICGFAMNYTRSIIAPTLIHAGADLMIIIPIFSMYGAK